MTVRCPHCAKPIANSPAFAGRLVKCPNCTQQFKMPTLGGPPPVPAATPAPVQAPRPSQSASADQGVSDQELFGAIVGGGPEQAAASPGGSAQKRTRTSKVGIVVALVVGIVIGYLAGSGKGRSGGIVGVLGGGTITKDAWIAKAKQHGFFREDYHEGVQLWDLKKEKFFEVMGKPDDTQAMDDRLTWYYKCSDGVIALTLSRGHVNRTGTIGSFDVNEY